MSHTVTVTGATGNVGGELVRRLRDKGVRVRAVARHEDRLKALGEGVEAHAGSLDDAAFLTRAFSGADAVFAMIPPSYGEPDFRAYQRRLGEAIAQAVAAARVPRVVTLSSVGADLASGNGPIAGLHELEKRLEAVPDVHLLHLRPAYFMENELSGLALIKSAGISGSPIRADLPQAMVATRDIGVAAAESLASPTFTGRSFRELLGPRDYTHREVARILGAAIGRPELPYVEFPYEDAKKAMVGAGLTPDLAGLYVEMHQAFNEGRVRSLQGRTPHTTTPTTLETFAKEVFAPAFQS